MGRGLSALISAESPSSSRAEEIQEVDIELIRPSLQQPRSRFNPERLRELAQSIKSNGIIQPLLLIRKGGLYELIAGERRWRAARLAGFTRLPAIIREVPEEKLLELSLIENIQRQDLNPIEEANAYKHLIERLGLTHDSLAERVGKDRTAITNFLRLLKLPSDLQSLVEDEKLSMGHARALLGLDAPATQRRFARNIISKGWSVRETEERIKRLNGRAATPKQSPKPTPLQDPNIRAAESRLRRQLHTQVRIIPPTPTTPGHIQIEYYSLSDLDRLYELLMTPKLPA